MATRRPERARPRFTPPGKIHHVAVIVSSIEASLALYRDLLGLPLETIMDIPSDRVRIAVLGVGESKVELVQPTDDTTGVARFLANKGEGLTGLEVLVGRIAAKRLGKPVHPRLDADGFRAHRKDALEELARQSAEEVRRSRRPSLLPPLAPWERRLVHLALAEDAEVETQSEGDGFLKRVEVRLKSR